ncbi:hypothetical protein ACE6H2_001680 [Prunus campanulata]
MANATQSISSASDPSKSESEDKPWVSSTIDSIIRDAMFGESGENPKAKEEPKKEDEPMVETLARIIVISSDDEEEPMEESEIKVILVESSEDESSDDESMEELKKKWFKRSQEMFR